MKPVTLQAHFDGQQIRLDEPYELKPGTALAVIVTPDEDAEGRDWLLFPAEAWKQPMEKMNPSIRWS